MALRVPSWIRTDLCVALQAHRLSTIQNADMIAGGMLSGSPSQRGHPPFCPNLGYQHNWQPLQHGSHTNNAFNACFLLCSCPGRGYC